MGRRTWPTHSPASCVCSMQSPAGPQNSICWRTARVSNRWDEFYMPFLGTTAYETGLGYWRRGRMRSFALVEPESPRMSLTLDAVENNRLSPSLRRGAREGDFRDLCILTSHGGRSMRSPWLWMTRLSLFLAIRRRKIYSGSHVPAKGLHPSHRRCVSPRVPGWARLGVVWDRASETESRFCGCVFLRTP